MTDLPVVPESWMDADEDKRKAVRRHVKDIIISCGGKLSVARPLILSAYPQYEKEKMVALMYGMFSEVQKGVRKLDTIRDRKWRYLRMELIVREALTAKDYTLAQRVMKDMEAVVERWGPIEQWGAGVEKPASKRPGRPSPHVEPDDALHGLSEEELMAALDSEEEPNASSTD